jgi:DNA processing protein
MGDDLKTVAIVGTRSPSEYGKMMTDKIVADLKPFNVNIISGLAYGIDTIAHQACVNNKINTIAVLGQGLKNIYPAQNRTLAKRIMDHGSLISEFPFNTQPDRENFPRRNRIIAGMSDAIIVVESAAKGGSIITANYGNDYFKDVFAIPGKIGDKKSEGCNKLIKQNKAHLLESVADIAYIMNWEKDDPKPKQMTLALDLDDDERRIVAFMKEEQVTNIDQMHYALELSLSNLSSSLLNLEFKGIVRSLPGKKYNLAI